jgi:AraC-like DNA-binding protein/quercetin dioxygenase-like cupin family protein
MTWRASLYRLTASEGSEMTTASVIELMSFDMAQGQSFDHHAHPTHQLAWASTGVLMADTMDRCWLLPPHLALWIPGGVPHAQVALRDTVMLGIYFDPDQCPLRWDRPVMLAVSALARELIEYLAGGLPDDTRARAEAVLLDVLRPVEAGAIVVPMPVDERARDIARILLDNPADSRSLEQFARDIGSSPRTLLRLFLAETGLTFNEWRVQARLQASVAHLAEGRPVSSVAGQVGYTTASAFVAAFRRVTGLTPAAYLGHLTGE